MTKRFAFPETYGLVLCGGQSNRMGSDKSLLQYYNKPQRYHVYDMLIPFCEKVFISCSVQQATDMEAGYDLIIDDEAFTNIGPMAALLSAWKRFPQKNLLLVGCDYPFLSAGELENLATRCSDLPASFYNEEATIYESMLAWYPHTCFNEVEEMFIQGRLSLQELLRKFNAVKYLPADPSCIISVDTPEAFRAAVYSINAR